MILALSMIAPTAQADDGNFRCQQRDATSGYSIQIEVTTASARILQASPTARYAPIQLALQSSQFSGMLESPDISCSETRGQYSIHILVKDSRVQVLQSAPNARYAPIQLNAVE